MKRILSLIFTYFTVAVLLTVAVAPLWDNIDVGINNSVISADGTAEGETSEDTKASDGDNTENLTEEDNTKKPSCLENVSETDRGRMSPYL